jgi:hypothetical protein
LERGAEKNLTEQCSAGIAVLIVDTALLFALHGECRVDEIVGRVKVGPVVLQLTFDRHFYPKKIRFSSAKQIFVVSGS